MELVYSSVGETVGTPAEGAEFATVTVAVAGGELTSPSNAVTVTVNTSSRVVDDAGTVVAPASPGAGVPSTVQA